MGMELIIHIDLNGNHHLLLPRKGIWIRVKEVIGVQAGILRDVIKKGMEIQRKEYTLSTDGCGVMIMAAASAFQEGTSI